MSICIKQALCFASKDEDWVKKIILGGLLMFFPTFAYLFPGLRRVIFEPFNYYMFALYFMFSLVIFMAVCGYFFKSVHIRIVHDEVGLPSWNEFWNYIYVGAKAYVGGFVVALPFLALEALILFFAPMTLSVEMLPYAVAVLLLHIAYSFLYTMLALNFSLSFSIRAFFRVKKAYAIIHKNMGNFVLMVGCCLLVALVHLVLGLLLVHAQILGLLLPFVSFYIFLIYSDLFAQFVLNGKEVEIHQEQRCLA